MKRITFISVMFFTASMVAHAQSGTVVKIRDERNKKKVPINCQTPAAMAEYYAECAKHKHHDVEVSLTLFENDNSYEVTYYQNENDTMKRHKFSVGLPTQSDKAEYRWDHDTVCVSFFHKESKRSKVYRGYGYGNTSSMFMDD